MGKWHKDSKCNRGQSKGVRGSSKMPRKRKGLKVLSTKNKKNQRQDISRVTAVKK